MGARPSSVRSHLVLLAAVSAVVILCVWLVDRPLALWMDERFWGTTLFAVAAAILRPLDALPVIMAALLTCAAL